VLAASLPAFPASAVDLPVPIVAAENFYGEVAAAVGGDRVTVESIIVAPGTDPHDFEPAPSTARLVADARIVVMNGADYDHWMERLVEGSSMPERTVIDVAALLGTPEGANPHLWYDPRAVPALADALAAELARRDPEGAAGYASRAKALVASLEEVNQRIADLRARFAGTPVTASEPLFGPMADALGLDMKHRAVQVAVMHETEPAARDIAAMEDDLKSGRVKVFFYNSQVVDPLTEQLLAAAAAGKVPVVGVSETEPEGMSYAAWMLGTLEATAKALAAPSS
jgi:zinc/manganese transport system substrate-binding protein